MLFRSGVKERSLSDSLFKAYLCLTSVRTIRPSCLILNELNNSKTEFGMVKEFDGNGGVTRPATIKDLQDLNSEIIASICDQLGMSDICLGGNKK